MNKSIKTFEIKTSMLIDFCANNTILSCVFFFLITDLYLIVCFYHVTYEFVSESTLYSCLNVKELLARSRRHI